MKSKKSSAKANYYLEKECLIDIIKLQLRESSEAFPPDLEDLTRLHQLIRSRDCQTVLEFGIGFSSIIIADALMKNEGDYLGIESNFVRYKIIVININYFL